MNEKLFNETFFKKNNYFRKELNLSPQELKKYLELIENWQKNCTNFNPDMDKETTDENEFIDIVFKKILGYSGKGSNSNQYQLFPKFKIEGASSTGKSGFVDLALGHFSKEQADAEVIIEFKGQDSDDLNRLSNRADKLSPLDQCWKYLVNHPKAKWGIVTNFNEIRIYNKSKGQSTYEVFYFLVPEEYQNKYQPLSVETELLKFITILKKDHLLSQNNLSFTEEILKSKWIEESKVQKEFYLEYKALRSDIFYELLKCNPVYQTEKPKSRLLELVQKFLDRIIFCWFCGIAIDEGKGFGIESGYNGELFKTDEELDILKIPNFLLERISNIGLKYDFGDENELNVNILGHIFEQSIADLEEMRVSFQEYNQTYEEVKTQQVLGFSNEVEVIQHKQVSFDKKKTRRKKEGVYYTPDYITNYIVEQTLGQWLKEKEQIVKKKHSDVKKNKEYTILREYRDEYLSKVKVLDPACGSGAFLIAAFNYLWKEHERIYNSIKEIKKKASQIDLFDFDLIQKTILENNLYGVDLNRESVEITKLSLWLKTAAKNKKLNDLSKNIKMGNSLVDDPNIAGELAFDWIKEFPDIFESKRKTNPAILVAHAKTKKAGFDIVIGNPPYVRADVDNPIYQQQRKWMENCGKYETLYEKWDLYIPFIERGLHLLDKDGILSFIISNSYNTVKYAEKSRKFIYENYELRQINFFENVEVFEGVGVESVILNIKNSKENQSSIPIRVLHRNNFDTFIQLPKKEKIEDIFRISSSIHFENKFSETELLGNICFVSKGMVLHNEEKENGKNLFKKDDLISNIKDSLHSRNFVEAEIIGRYYIKEKRYLEWNTDRVPSQLSRPTFPELYIFPKVIRGRTTDAIYDTQKTLCNEGCILFVPFHSLKNVENRSINNSIQKWNQKERTDLEKISKNFDLKYLLAILNSKFAKFYLNTIRRHRIEYYFYPDDLKQLPIKKLTLQEQKPFIQKVDTMISKSQKLLEKKEEFLTLLKSDFQLDKLSEKLQDWYLLDWSEFIAELKKRKINLSNKQEEKYLERFNRTKKIPLELRDTIENTDREIDSMVYKLYGLTKEEIQLVEGI